MLTFHEHKINDYELVLETKDPARKFHALFIIHNTKRGAGIGGIRSKNYANIDEAMTDGLRLARGMTLKSSAANIMHGGAKSIILLQPKQQKTLDILEAYSEALNQLQGKYYCGIDLGTTPNDIKIIAKNSPYTVGLDNQSNVIDLSKFTAWGCFKGIQASANFKWGKTDLHGKVIAIQGLGNVGRKLAEHLFWAGAKLIVCDINDQLTQSAVRDLGATAQPFEHFIEQSCDILSPCAIGGIITPQTIPNIQCEIIAGAANNQLFNEDSDHLLYDNDILYAPDFIINAGGLIAAASNCQNKQQFSAKQCRDDTHKIYDRLMGIFQQSKQKKIPTNQVASQLAMSQIDS